MRGNTQLTIWTSVAVLVLVAGLFFGFPLYKANRIMAEGLGGPEAYLRWSYINMLQETAGQQGRQTIYVPTEAGMPILEAGRIANQRPAE